MQFLESFVRTRNVIERDLRGFLREQLRARTTELHRTPRTTRAGRDEPEQETDDEKRNEESEQRNEPGFARHSVSEFFGIRRGDDSQNLGATRRDVIELNVLAIGGVRRFQCHIDALIEIGDLYFFGFTVGDEGEALFRRDGGIVHRGEEGKTGPHDQQTGGDVKPRTLEEFLHTAPCSCLEHVVPAYSSQVDADSVIRCRRTCAATTPQRRGGAGSARHSRVRSRQRTCWGCRNRGNRERCRL